jgi:1,4-dihydroxy-2-naphthoate octaprenyltransferase
MGENKLKFWYWNARPQALPQSLMPAILAFCLAIGNVNFSWKLGLLAIVGVAFAHLSLNLFDDYFDYKVKKSDFRDRMAHKGIRARIAKCDYLTSGQATVRQLLATCLLMGGISLFIGSIIFYFRGINIIFITATTAILSISYSGPPLQLSYRGLGEIVIGIVFGPLLMAGVYISACGKLDNSLLFISIPVGLFIANIIYIHSIMDFEPDREAGKMTFAGLLKHPKAMLAALFLLFFIAYSSVIFGIITGYLSIYYLFTLLTIPMTIALFYLMLQFIRHPEKNYNPHWWYGPMRNWDKIKEYQLDWFMLRWLLARNLLVFFCLIIICVTMSGGSR